MSDSPNVPKPSPRRRRTSYNKSSPLDTNLIKPGQWVTILGPNLRFFSAPTLSDDPDGEDPEWRHDHKKTLFALRPSNREFDLIGIPMQVVAVMDPLVLVCCFNAELIPVHTRTIDTRGVALGPCSKNWVKRFFAVNSTILAIQQQPNPPKDEIPAVFTTAGFGLVPYTNSSGDDSGPVLDASPSQGHDAEDDDDKGDTPTPSK